MQIPVNTSITQILIIYYSMQKNNPIKIQRFYFVFLDTQEISRRNVLMKICEGDNTVFTNINIKTPQKLITNNHVLFVNNIFTNTSTFMCRKSLQIMCIKLLAQITFQTSFRIRHNKFAR